MRIRTKLLAGAAGLMIAGGALFGVSAANATGAVCTNPSIVFNGQDSQGLDEYYADADIWNPEDITQKMGVCSKDSWYVEDKARDTGDGAVQSYPNIHRDFHDWGTDKDTENLSDVGSIPSHFEQHGPSGQGSYDVAYDLWFNGVADNDSTEVMIWTDYHNQTPAGKKLGTVTVDGHVYDFWAESGNGYIAFVSHDKQDSGDVDLKDFADYLVQTGHLKADATFGQLDYGVEIVDTDGATQHWDFTGFSVDAVKGDGGPTSESPDPTPTDTGSTPPPTQHAANKLLTGEVSVKPVAGKPTRAHVSFPANSFDHKPSVMLTVGTSVPGTVVKGVGVTHVTATGFDVVLTRSNSTATGVYWMAK